MIGGEQNKRGIGAAKRKPSLISATAALVLGSVLQCKPALAVADCSSAPVTASIADGAVGGRSASLHSASFRSALRGTVGTPAMASSQASCHRTGGTSVSMASALLPRSYVARPLIDGYSVINPRIANSSPTESAAAAGTSLERESGLEARFGVRWQTMPGPAWVQRVPSWVIQDARTYHRRGLPVLHLWESSNYLVALGLSNHGVPGVYFSQKLP
jgi:hypothetical protein